MGNSIQKKQVLMILVLGFSLGLIGSEVIRGYSPSVANAEGLQQDSQGIPNPGRQRKEMIDKLQDISRDLSEVKSKLNGTLKVSVENAEDFSQD